MRRICTIRTRNWIVLTDLADETCCAGRQSTAAKLDESGFAKKHSS